MSAYYGNRWYSRRRRFFYRPRSVRTPDTSSPYWKSLQFVRAEFFQFSPVTFERFLLSYACKYGEGPKQYVQRTYEKWKSGSTKMAGQSERRILECVPPFLDKKKQFELLSFQVPTVMKEQKDELKISSMHTSAMQPTYCRIAESISKYEHKLDWFVNEVFPSAEVVEFVNVFKYIMLDCLRGSYSLVRKDVMMMRDAFSLLDGSADLTYHIAFLDCRLVVDVYPLPGEPELPFSIPAPKLITEFREQYRQLLLKHILDQSNLDAGGEVNRRIALSDIQTVANQLQSTGADQEYDAKLEVQGKGGTLNIHLQKKNLLRLRYGIAKQTLALSFAACISAVIIVWLCVKGVWPILIYLGFIPVTIICSIWSKLKKLKSEVNEYERKRTSRLTAT